MQTHHTASVISHPSVEIAADIDADRVSPHREGRTRKPAREATELAERAQSRGEELANSVCHAVGALAAAIGTPFLVVSALEHGAAAVVGAVAFATGMLLVYFASTLYHALPQGRPKAVFKIVDHSVIFLLIAGTYTPFTLGVLHGTWGWVLFGAVWSLAAIGVALKTLRITLPRGGSAALYLMMGWIAVVAVGPLVRQMPLAGLLLLLAGGVFYSAGVYFYTTDGRIRFGHFVWHLLVIAGTVSHYFAVLLYANWRGGRL